MIDNFVDIAVASLLQASTSASGVQGLTVIVGLEDNVPDLLTPYLVIYSNVISQDAKNPVYTLKTTIDLVTLSGVADEDFVANTMTIIDNVLDNQPSPAILVP